MVQKAHVQSVANKHTMPLLFPVSPPHYAPQSLLGGLCRHVSDTADVIHHVLTVATANHHRCRVRYNQPQANDSGDFAHLRRCDLLVHLGFGVGCIDKGKK